MESHMFTMTGGFDPEDLKRIGKAIESTGVKPDKYAFQFQCSRDDYKRFMLAMSDMYGDGHVDPNKDDEISKQVDNLKETHLYIETLDGRLVI